MFQVAVATSSALAADAAREIIDAGGNAVDAALAASLLTMNTQPGVCALAGGALVTIWPANGDPLSYDGYVTVPGLDHDNTNSGIATTSVTMAYGGGVTTTIGAGSVAVPGSPAAVEQARNDFGNLSLSALLAPSIRAAKCGFPLPSACHHYLGYSGKTIFGLDADAHAALYPTNGELIAPGAKLIIPGLADSLQLLADDGIDAFYKGDLAKALVRHLNARGSRMTMADLERYQVDRRPSHRVRVGDWSLAVSPPPSIGGSMLAAIMMGIDDGVSLAQMLRSALQYRRGRLDFSDDLPRDTSALLQAAAVDATKLGGHISDATVHTSAVDSNGLACAITASAGYGSGEVPIGTGLWLNNCLGELELNRHGLDAGPPGARLPSNMSPSTARNGHQSLAIGSPGADRITSALSQTLQRFMLGGQSLAAAIEAPRLHIEASLDADEHGHFAETLCLEPNVDDTALSFDTVRHFDQPSMFFGGVGGALMQLDKTDAPELSAAADSRRNGGVCVHPPVHD